MCTTLQHSTADVCHICSGLKLAEQIAMNNVVPRTFVYIFRGPGVDGNYYAPHASEVAYVMNTGTSESEEESFKIPWQQRLSDAMLSAWNNMGCYGTPNITNQEGGEIVEWTPFDVDTGSVLILQSGDGGIRNEKEFKGNYRKNVCDYWYNEIGPDVMRNVCHNFTGL